MKKDILIHSDFLPKCGFVFDMFSRRWLYIHDHVLNLKIKSRVDSLTGKVIPVVRVFVYEAVPGEAGLKNHKGIDD